MKRKWIIWLGVLVVVLIAGGAYANYRMKQAAIVTVQTAKVVRQDLAAIVTASGEIKPKNYINIDANVQGVLTAILVKEGDHVRKDQVVARIEAIQALADVDAQKATVASALADSAAAEANLKSMDDAVLNAQATLDRTKADLDRTKAAFDRAQSLYQDKLIAKQDFEQKRSDYETGGAAVRESQTKVDQMKSQRAQGVAQLSAAQRKVTQQQANLTRIADMLAKHNATAPINGVVTNLPVRTGETVVPGVQNSEGSTIMTIADMSVITAEVKVDETDIVNVQVGQPADVTIDAIPNKTFKGTVTDIGNTAIIRSTGLAASQSAVSSQEAKDFKVVIALTNPPDEIRPGLSCTAKIITATRSKAISVPVQAMTVRQRGDLEPIVPGKTPPPVDPRDKKAKEELQGVFVVKDGKAEFHKLDTGITGTTDIEVLSGLNEGDEVITGSYKVIKTLRNEVKVKVDNKAPSSEPAKS
ncbi:MAG TPA: efflux RND transporter periplasmic adaptor subunit [Bryobacteraceae bacterium]